MRIVGDRRDVGMDLLGVVLFLGLAGWAVLTAGATGGDAGPLATVVVAIGATFLAARYVTRVNPALVPALVVGAAAYVALEAGADVTGSLRGPLGYANATGQFFVMGEAAALLLFARSRSWALRIAASTSAAGCAAVPILSESLAAALLAVVLPVGLFGLTGRRAARWVLAVAAAVTALVLVATVTLGLLGADRASEVVANNLTERRVALWSDALAQIADEPLTGVGPGRFEEVSPTALSDQDAVWAHNDLLEVGAETGVAGLLLALGLVAWAFVRLRTGGGVAGAAVGAVALMSLVVHASVDYVLHFPAVGMAGAAVTGAGSATRLRGRESVD